MELIKFILEDNGRLILVIILVAVILNGIAHIVEATRNNKES